MWASTSLFSYDSVELPCKPISLFSPSHQARPAVCCPHARYPWAFVSHPYRVLDFLEVFWVRVPQTQLALESSVLSRLRLLSWRIWLKGFHLWILLRKNMSRPFWELTKSAGNAGSVVWEVILMLPRKDTLKRSTCKWQPIFLCLHFLSITWGYH